MANPLDEPTELLFSYGTLRLKQVQLATFGRSLTGAADLLVGYGLGWLEIGDSTVVEASGESRHPIIAFTGREEDLVHGTAFRVTHEELRHADAYEVADYKRKRVTLASGRTAWVFVDARDESE